MRRRVGHITRLREGAYYVQITRGRKADGTLRRVNKVVYGTAEEAELELARIAQKLGVSEVYGDSMTLHDYYWQIFRDKPSNRGTPRSPSTLRGYDNQMTRNIEPMLGHFPMDDITHSMLATCIHDSSSPRNTKRTLSAVLMSAYDDELITEKPFSRRVTVHQPKKEQELPWTPSEVAEALTALEGTEVEPYLILGLSGLRKSEALGVRPMDIAIQSIYSVATGELVETMTVSVEQTFTDDGGLAPRAKNDYSLRTVPVFVPGRERLAEIIRDLPPTERILDMSSNYLTRLWKRNLEKAGLRYIPPKLLRHTSDTLMLTAGIPQDLNDKMHGRTEHSSTYQNYYRPDISAMENAAHKMGELLHKDTN